jgi:hypothetical protein
MRKRTAGIALALLAAIVVLARFPWASGILFVIIGAIPWLALWFVRRSPGRYRLSLRTDTTYVNLTPLLLMPGVGLAGAALAGIRPLHPVQLMVPAALICGSLFAAALWADPSRRQMSGENIATLVLLFLYGAGAAALLDARLDRSEPQVYRADRIDSRVSSSRAGTKRSLLLMPWGPQTEVTWVSVSRATFEAAGRGELVCIDLYSGALRVAWYTVDPCK